VARLQGSVLAGLDKNRAARQGSNDYGDVDAESA